MSSIAKSAVLVDGSASDFAFRAGQLLERLLVERGVDAASRSGLTVVTSQHIESCLSDPLLDDLRKTLGADTNAEFGSERRKSA